MLISQTAFSHQPARMFSSPGTLKFSGSQNKPVLRIREKPLPENAESITYRQAAHWLASIRHHPERFFADYPADVNNILEIQKNISKKGNVNYGVFSVKLKHNPSNTPKVLKIYSARCLEEEKGLWGLMLNSLLSRCGVTPKIYDIIPQKQLQSIIDRFPGLTDYQKKHARLGVLTDRIMGEFSRDLRPLSQYKPGLYGTVYEQAGNHRQTLDRLGILAGDSQWMLSMKDKRLWLIDTDRFQWVSPSGKTIGYLARSESWLTRLIQAIRPVKNPEIF